MADPFKYATEAEAWRGLAEQFSKRSRGYYDRGLCSAVDSLDALWYGYVDLRNARAYHVTRAVRNGMQERLHQHVEAMGKEPTYDYAWPPTNRRVRQLACLMLAEEAESEAAPGAG